MKVLERGQMGLNDQMYLDISRLRIPPEGHLIGRDRVYTDFDEINSGNVIEALNKANAIHEGNRVDIQYLVNYYRGLQPIYNRDKTTRPDIKHNTVVNHANEIVSFKTSYLLSDPIVYIARKPSEDGMQDERVTEGLKRLNDYMYLAGVQACDKEIADGFHIAGQSYRFVFVNADWDGEDGEDDSPYTVETLDGENTYVAYRRSSSKATKPVFAVTFTDRMDMGRVYDVWTRTAHYVVNKNEIISTEANVIGEIPIIEYVNNEYRIGAFEVVLDLLDAANVIKSNRVEATEQLVQALTWFNDVEFTADELEQLKSNPSAFVFTRTIKDCSNPMIKAIVTDLQQADQQVLQNAIYKDILTIAGMPSTGDGNTSDSSNNGSTIVRNGWQHAEARAKDTAALWERSDRQFLKVVLKICDVMLKKHALNLKPSDIRCKFTRRNYEDIATKATVLTMLLGNDLVHPETAWQVCNMVPDPEDAYNAGMQWHAEKRKEEQEDADRDQQRQIALAENQRGTVGGEYDRTQD